MEQGPTCILIGSQIQTSKSAECPALFGRLLYFSRFNKWRQWDWTQFSESLDVWSFMKDHFSLFNKGNISLSPKIWLIIQKKRKFCPPNFVKWLHYIITCAGCVTCVQGEPCKKGSEPLKKFWIDPSDPNLCLSNTATVEKKTYLIKLLQ